MSADTTHFVIPDTQVHRFESHIVENEFEIIVRLPPGYEESDMHYPVLYFLDAFEWGAIFPEMMRIGERFQDFPKIILVGISYPTRELEKFYSLRRRDMTPGQGSANFLRFIREELIPFIESAYRIDPQERTLQGHSLGGMFVLYALFSEPSSFHNYLSFSPGLNWNDRFLFKLEEDYAQKHSDLPVKLFLAGGALEDDEPFGLIMPLEAPLTELFEVLTSRGYPGLEVEKLMLDGEDHALMPPPALVRAVNWLYGDRSLLNVLYNTFKKSGLDAALDRYHDLKENHSQDYSFDSSHLNFLGYILLRTGRHKEAIEFFKLNVEAYPQTANVHDSLGEAYMTVGESDLAIESYLLALEIEPEMPSAIHALEKLGYSPGE